MRTATGLSQDEIQATSRWIASVQAPDGMIPWFDGGHADPWNHTEAAMALSLAGLASEAEAAFEWLLRSQQSDGTWCLYYLADGVEDPRRDPNVCAYIATGAWWHYLLGGDDRFLARVWPAVETAMAFVLRLQAPGGEILWSMDVDGVPGRFALLTANASIHHSFRCALAIAGELGYEQPEWELAAGRIAGSVAHRPDSFRPKDRWAMDWYYPILGGLLGGEAGSARVEERWDAFVLPGLGTRCVADQPWVTAAETSELAIAMDALGQRDRARALLEWVGHLREGSGAYWTGCVHPQCVRFPGGERTTYSSAAVLIADHVVWDKGGASGMFRGDGLPETFELVDAPEKAGER